MGRVANVELEDFWQSDTTGGIGPQVSMANMSPEFQAWTQAFNEFMETNPTDAEINAWMAANSPPRQ